MSVLCEIIKKIVIWQFKVKYATILNLNIEDQRKAYYKKETAVPSLIHFQVPNPIISPQKFLLLITVYYSSVVTYHSV